MCRPQNPTVRGSRQIHSEKPSGLLIEQPTKFELVINLKTAKMLGLMILTTVLALADGVIG